MTLAGSRGIYVPEILATRLDESWTLYFQLGLTNVFTFYILTMTGVTNIFRNVFWTRQIKLLQVSRRQIKLLQVSRRQIKLLQVSRHQIKLLQVSRRQIKLLQVSRHQIKLLQVSHHQIKLLQVSRRPIDTFFHIYFFYQTVFFLVFIFVFEYLDQ